MTIHNLPPKKPKSNGKGQHLSNREIKSRIQKLREAFIKQIERLKKKGK